MYRILFREHVWRVLDDPASDSIVWGWDAVDTRLPSHTHVKIDTSVFPIYYVNKYLLGKEKVSVSFPPSVNSTFLFYDFENLLVL